MAAVLSNNMSDIKQVTLFHGRVASPRYPCIGPDVNESLFKFRVNAAGAIRFGLGAMRGVGEGAVEAIIAGREDGAGQLQGLV
jgi:DNA polymerase-3 subunit alpha